MEKDKLKRTVYVLELYVSGNSFVSERAITAVRALCESELKGQYSLKVIDLYEDPERAIAENIIAVPTLYRKSPSPARQIIGDLQNRERVMRGLEIA